MSERVAYAEAGAAMRQAVDRALAADLGPRPLKVLLVVLAETASWSKLTDRLYVTAVAAKVFRTDDPQRWQVDKVGRDLRRLHDLGIIKRDPPRRGRPKAGTGARTTIVLPTADPDNAATDGRITDEECSRSRREMQPPASRNAAAHGRPSEDLSEDLPEAPRDPSNWRDAWLLAWTAAGKNWREIDWPGVEAGLSSAPRTFAALRAARRETGPHPNDGDGMHAFRRAFTEARR